MEFLGKQERKVDVYRAGFPGLETLDIGLVLFCLLKYFLQSQ